MFDYRFTRNAEEYTARLRREAVNNRLARAVSPPLAGNVARLFRAWADRLEAQAARRPAPTEAPLLSEGPGGATPHAELRDYASLGA